MLQKFLLLSLAIVMMAMGTATVQASTADHVGDEIQKNDQNASVMIPVGDEALTTNPTDKMAFKWWEGHGAELRKFLFQLWTNDEPVMTTKPTKTV